MKVAFKDPNPGIYFALDNESGIKVRALNEVKMKEITDEVTTTSEEVRGGRIVTHENVDEKLRAELVYDYCIVGWTNITDENGEEIEFTRENKLKLVRENPNFTLTINEMIAVAGSKQALDAENELKNFFLS